MITFTRPVVFEWSIFHRPHRPHRRQLGPTSPAAGERK